MITNWVTTDIIKEAFPKTTMRRLNKVHELLLERYPTGEDWLTTPIAFKKPVKYEITDLQHILTWAWERELFIHPIFSKKIEEYILSGYFYHLNLTLTNFALNKKVIDAELIRKIEEFSSPRSRILRRAVILISLFSMKSFNNVTDKDVETNNNLLKRLSSQQMNCIKHLQDFRVYMGYSRKIVKRRTTTQSNWYYLKNNHPSFTKMFEKYHNYLIGGGLSKSTIKGRSIALKRLFEFLDENDLKNCRGFNQEDYLHYTSWLKNKYTNAGTLAYVVSNTKKFFEWGIDIEEDYSFFPERTEYPNRQWQKLNSDASVSSYNSEGHSFAKRGIAKAFVRTLNAYKPVNETEELAKNFMMLLTSTPCRLNYLRLLPMDCLFRMKNGESIKLFGVTSEMPDKAGNVYGEFPILDESGVRAIEWLKRRCITKGFQPIENPVTGKEYVHLFQLERPPYILTEHNIYIFIETIKNKMPNKYKVHNITPHKFRTKILTEITSLTRDVTVAQTAAGHRNISMTKTYLRSDISQDALLNTIKEGFENGEYSGKFYLRLLEVLTMENTSHDIVLNALTTEIKFNEFLRQFGIRRDMGYCLSQDECANHYKCWGCKHFLMKRDEIETAIKTLSTSLINFKAMMKYSDDFTFDNPIVASKQKTITLIIKRICQLGVTPEQVMDMVEQYLNNKDLGEVLKNEY